MSETLNVSSERGSGGRMPRPHLDWDEEDTAEYDVGVTLKVYTPLDKGLS